MQRMAAGRWAEAAEAASSWQETGEALGMQHPAVKSSFVVWGESSLRAGDTASARAFVARVRALPAGQLTPYVEAHGHRIAALLGEGDDPAAELAMAVATLRRIGYRFDLMLALADAAEVSAGGCGMGSGGAGGGARDRPQAGRGAGYRAAGVVLRAVRRRGRVAGAGND